MASTKISPFLWFDTQAEEAANLYTSIFKNSEIKNIARYTGEGAKASGQPEGTVMTVAFSLDGQNFTAINGGPIFKFTEAVSFVINCENQEEVDHFWNKLTEGGQESQCGWLKDKFGLSWQVVPKQLGELMSGPNAGKVMGAMLKMKKIVIKDLEDAANQ
ncbi:MAG: 3-demethylubiquinone-9 3-methyltransferase [Chitinophagaceae bacterium]|nr:3-demethylubiquinone-9 3-methyltransferase [Chitinophagaceae bacterium]